MNEIVQSLIAEINNTRYDYFKSTLYATIYAFTKENGLDLKSGSSRFVLIDDENNLVIKIAKNSFGIDQNRSETNHSDEPFAAKVLENYNNTILVSPKYDMLSEYIHDFLAITTEFKNYTENNSITQILLEIIDDSFENWTEAQNNEDSVIMQAIDEIANLFETYPNDIHEDNFGVDENDKPVMLDMGMDDEFIDKHESSPVSDERFSIEDMRMHLLNIKDTLLEDV